MVVFGVGKTGGVKTPGGGAVSSCMTDRKRRKEKRKGFGGEGM